MFDFDFDIEHDASPITEDVEYGEAEYTGAGYDMMPYDLAEHVSIGSCDVSSVAFTGHIDDLYNPHINSANEDYLYHIKEVTQSDSIDGIKHHADKAIEATKSKEYWENCKFNAEIEAEKNDIFLNHINRQWEIMEQTQRDLEAISKGEYGKQLSFGSGELSLSSSFISDSEPLANSQISFGNHWDDRTAEFVSLMKEHGIDIPSSVNHSSSYSDVVTMDRHSNGGMLSIDKAICRNRIEDALKNGKISQSEYKIITDKLSSC